MKRSSLLSGAAGMLILAAAALSPAVWADSASMLQPVSAFDGISETEARSAALFEEAGKVLTHARCVNCHPSGESPRQGDSRQMHRPPVRRGENGMGVAGMRCTTCHTAQNFDPAQVPGDPHWALAPESMAWEGLSVSEICVQIKDPKRNGERSLEAIVEHVTKDSLVGWAWDPGEDREPAPGSQEEFAALMKAWAETGAVCPEADAAASGGY